jgi:hypothetical protein
MFPTLTQPCCEVDAATADIEFDLEKFIASHEVFPPQFDFGHPHFQYVTSPFNGVWEDRKVPYCTRTLFIAGDIIMCHFPEGWWYPAGHNMERITIFRSGCCTYNISYHGRWGTYCENENSTIRCIQWSCGAVWEKVCVPMHSHLSVPCFRLTRTFFPRILGLRMLQLRMLDFSLKHMQSLRRATRHT